MKTGFIEVPQFPLHVYNTVQKSGSRTEYSLNLSDELIDLGHKISDLPLKFASLVKAFPAEDAQDQDFHADSNSGERAIMYLTDVLDETSGPIEFQQYGKILGKSGTYVHYSANEIHRGCASAIDRYALALAFDNSSHKISTIGAATCENYECPSGYKLKSPLGSSDGDLTDEICCEKSSNTMLIVGIIAVVLIWYFYFRR